MDNTDNTRDVAVIGKSAKGNLLFSTFYFRAMLIKIYIVQVFVTAGNEFRHQKHISVGSSKNEVITDHKNDTCIGWLTTEQNSYRYKLLK